MNFSFFKSTFSQNSLGNNIVTLPCLWPYRLLNNIIILAFIASVAMIIVMIRDNLIDKKIDQILQDFYTYTTEYGWQIDDFIIQGREKTTKNEILAQIDPLQNDNILKIDLKEIKSKIEQLPWVETASVKRNFFPNVVHISISEKKVVALWQSKDQFFPIDENGRIIEAEFIPTKPILIIVGQNAPEKLNQLLEAISISPQIIKRVKAAKLYAGRRWDIILDDIENGLTIKMPEDHMERAWKKFLKINNQHGLLKRKLTFIDLRYKNKLIVTVDNLNNKDGADHKKQ